MIGATSGSGGPPAGSVPGRWLLAVAAVWAALFGGAYALGSAHGTGGSTTTVTRTTPQTLTVAPGLGSPRPAANTSPPPVTVTAIAPMAPVPVLRPYG